MRLVPILAVVLATAFLPENEPIAIRHDVDDRLYLELGAEYPSVVRVGESGGDGTLIRPDWVLTAAHVAEGMVRRTGGNLEVLVDGQSESIGVDQVILHPNFTPMGPHDLALIHLERPVAGVEPAKLYRLRDETGKPIVILGHGDTKLGTGGQWVSDGRLRGATNLVDEVVDAYIKFDFDEPGNATRLEGTAGPGDSGGPVMIDVEGIPHVAGVSSLGEPGRNGPGTYGAQENYVRVSSYADWIDAMIADPPSGALVNMPEGNPARRGPGPGARVMEGGGALPPGVFMLEEIGLLVRERDGRPIMAGRVDQLYPSALLEGGIRPPAVITKINGDAVGSAQVLKSKFDAIDSGATFTIEFEHQGQTQRFELTK